MSVVCGLSSSLLLLLLLLFVCGVSARTAGAGSVTVGVDKPNYETGQTIVVALSSATNVPADEVRPL